ncbi:hypothetical protein TNCV_316081 [Trichonephila clavipes]|nr:hypothetical protein TNCV_316081 [Trichonephila clavipes]
MLRTLSEIHHYAHQNTLTQFDPCDVGFCPAEKFGFLEKKHKLCKSATVLQSCSDSPQLSRSVLLQLKVPGLPMRTSSKAYNCHYQHVYDLLHKGGATIWPSPL